MTRRLAWAKAERQAKESLDRSHAVIDRRRPPRKPRRPRLRILKAPAVD